MLGKQIVVCNTNRCDKVALKTTCIKNVKFKILSK